MAKTVKDLMTVSGLGRDATKAAIRNGQLPGYVVGSRYVVPDEAFEDFCHGRWTPTPQPVTPIPTHVTPINPIKRRNVA